MNVAEASPTARLIDCSAFFDREARWLSFLAGPAERALFIHRLNGCYTDFLSRVAHRETDPTQVFDPALSQFVAPKKPFRVRRVVDIRRHLLDASFQDLEDVSLLVSAVENDGKGIPVLLRQYLKLSGRLLCFNVDRNFSDVVDGLLLVDLRQTEPRLMKRFMGKDGYRRFAAHHGLVSVPRPAGEAPEPLRKTA